MNDYCEWNGMTQFSHRLTIDGYFVKQRFWSWGEFTKMLENSSTDVILVQKSSYTQWILEFKSKADHNMWLFYSDKKEHHIQINMISDDENKSSILDLHREIKTWCDTNLVGLYELDFSGNGTYMRASVKEDQDAILFKLRWLGVDY
jgi:hypothetical protein